MLSLAPAGVVDDRVGLGHRHVGVEFADRDGEDPVLDEEELDLPEADVRNGEAAGVRPVRASATAVAFEAMTVRFTSTVSLTPGVALETIRTPTRSTWTL